MTPKGKPTAVPDQTGSWVLAFVYDEDTDTVIVDELPVLAWEIQVWEEDGPVDAKCLSLAEPIVSDGGLLGGMFCIFHPARGVRQADVYVFPVEASFDTREEAVAYASDMLRGQAEEKRGGARVRRASVSEAV